MRHQPLCTPRARIDSWFRSRLRQLSILSLRAWRLGAKRVSEGWIDELFVLAQLEERKLWQWRSYRGPKFGLRLGRPSIPSLQGGLVGTKAG